MRAGKISIYMCVWVFSPLLLSVMFGVFLWEIIKTKIFLFTLNVLVNETKSRKTCLHIKTKLKNSLKEMQ